MKETAKEKIDRYFWFAEKIRSIASEPDMLMYVEKNIGDFREIKSVKLKAIENYADLKMIARKQTGIDNFPKNLADIVLFLCDSILIDVHLIIEEAVYKLSPSLQTRYFNEIKPVFDTMMNLESIYYSVRKKRTDASLDQEVQNQLPALDSTTKDSIHSRLKRYLADPTQNAEIEAYLLEFFWNLCLREYIPAIKEIVE